ncbi:hypothetical protein [Halalkalicoccus jeotgali]|nr:hypothetical protein [Halalkalicoccus jeotgali]
MTNYYDLILVLIPIALLGIGGTLVGVGLPLPIAVPAAASVAIGLIGHALFVNDPSQPTPVPNSASTASPTPSQQPSE